MWNRNIIVFFTLSMLITDKSPCMCQYARIHYRKSDKVLSLLVTKALINHRFIHIFKTCKLFKRGEYLNSAHTHTHPKERERSNIKWN